MKKRDRNRGKAHGSQMSAALTSQRGMSRQFHCGNDLIHSFVVAALASAVAVPSMVWAQTAESTLRGQAPPNSTITASNMDTGAVRRTTAGADGRYALVGLPAGTYRVDAIGVLTMDT